MGVRDQHRVAKHFAVDPVDQIQDTGRAFDIRPDEVAPLAELGQVRPEHPMARGAEPVGGSAPAPAAV